MFSKSTLEHFQNSNILNYSSGCISSGFVKSKMERTVTSFRTRVLVYLFRVKVGKDIKGQVLMGKLEVVQSDDLHIIYQIIFYNNLIKGIQYPQPIFNLILAAQIQQNIILFRVLHSFEFIYLLIKYSLFIILHMSGYLRSYSNYQDVKLCPIEEKLIPSDEYFPKIDEGQIRFITSSHTHIHIQKLLKFIHQKYGDEGLRVTLIHKLFQSKLSQIAYYVPQLVYIAIKKPCKHMKKVLLYHAKNCQSLRRLILWNVKAFTVLMKENSPQIKKTIQQFEDSLVEPVQSKSRFNHSLKAIAMLTEASLILKKMPQQLQKEKLEKFIKRFNAEYLNNLKHDIIIPFRQAEGEKKSSNYVVRLVQGDCSCFPTRKRVPYRIIIETIDVEELKERRPDQKFEKIQKIEPDLERDLFNEVTESVQKKFQKAFMNIPGDIKNLYVIDAQQLNKLSQLKNYLNDIEKIDKQKQVNVHHGRLKAARSMSLNVQGAEFFKKSKDLNRYKIHPSPNLQKFESIYIPDIRSESRRSDAPLSHIKLVQMSSSVEPDSKKRKSDKYVEQEHKQNVQKYEQQIKDVDFIYENIFGKPWEQKKTAYRRQSFFRKFQSLRHRNVVVKGGDDLRQEIICMQLIYKMRDIIQQAGVKIYIKPYEIIVLSENSGILEFVSNSISIDQMKKKSDEDKRSITQFFGQVFQTEEKMRAAKQNFVCSLAGASIMTYVLKLKDRHNGNILLDMDGHIIHIDFGFILGMSPGGVNFQKSPFKFTKQYLEFMGGKKNNKFYDNFRSLFHQGMAALKAKAEDLALILEIMKEESDLDCFKKFDIDQFKNVFRPDLNSHQYQSFCYDLIQESCENNMTVYYDDFQHFSNGIMK